MSRRQNLGLAREAPHGRDRNIPHKIVTTHSIDQHIGELKRQVTKGLNDPESRQLAVKIVSGKVTWVTRNGSQVPVVQAWGNSMQPPGGKNCQPRHDNCEIQKVWNFLRDNCYYVFDIRDKDTFATLKWTMDAGGGDCFPVGTLMLTQGGDLVPVEELRPGMKIWGRDRWSEVTKKWFKGALPLTTVHMNNGSSMQLTEGHKVYVAVCHRHAARVESSSCHCPVSECEVVRMPVSELEPGMVLLQPDCVHAPEGDSWITDQQEAALAGLYLADGWAEESRIGIAGLDGHPKEAQKDLVAELAQGLGLNTSRHERYQRVYGKELAQKFASMGHKAPDKHLPSLRFGPGCAARVVEGILADAGRNSNGPSRTFTSTSKMLAMQLRVLLRMQGVSCGYRYVESHGGLGSNPVHRLQLRESEKGANKLLRVKEIDRAGLSVPCWDISTDDHYVYLPEHDVTVSNCDDATIAFATLLGAIGFAVACRVITTQDNPNEWVHVYPMVGVPKDGASGWVPLDITVKGKAPGWQYGEIAKYRDYMLVG